MKLLARDMNSLPVRDVERIRDNWSTLFEEHCSFSGLTNRHRPWGLYQNIETGEISDGKKERDQLIGEIVSHFAKDSRAICEFIAYHDPALILDRAPIVISRLKPNFKGLSKEWRQLSAIELGVRYFPKSFDPRGLALALVDLSEKSSDRAVADTISVLIGAAMFSDLIRTSIGDNEET